MNKEITFLRAAADRKSGDPVIYYRGFEGQIRDFFPLAAIEMLKQRREGTIEAERFTRGDKYVSIPPDWMIYASEDNTRFFYGEMDDEEERTTRDRLLEELPKEASKIDDVLARLAQVILAFDAGVLGADGKEFYDLVREDNGYLWMIQ